MRPKYAARVDDNESEIIQALESIGCDVIRIGKPVDLLVGYRKRNFLIEVKNPDNSYAGTDEQKEFIRDWRGQVRIVETAMEAITLVTKAYGGGRVCD